MMKFYLSVETTKHVMQNNEVVNNMITKIHILTDTNQEFYAEVIANTDPSISIINSMYPGMHNPNSELFINLPLRNTQIYNGTADELKEYVNIDIINIVGSLIDIKKALYHWLTRFNKKNVCFVYIFTDNKTQNVKDIDMFLMLLRDDYKSKYHIHTLDISSKILPVKTFISYQSLLSYANQSSISNEQLYSDSIQFRTGILKEVTTRLKLQCKI